MNYLKSGIKIDSNIVWHVFMLFCAISMIITLSDSAFAAAIQNDVIGATLCRIANALTGGIAKGIGTIAIFSVGVGLFMGKLNWGTAAATAAGIGIIFAAPTMISFITGSAVGACGAAVAGGQF